MHTFLLSLICFVLADAAAPWWEKASTEELAKALFIRGVPECEKCSTKDLQNLAKQHAAKPVDPELFQIYEEDVKYVKQQTSLNMTKLEFLNQMNASDGFKLDEARGERMWNGFQAQLESGGVTFSENGTMEFSMPLTHGLFFMPSSLCDAIEDAFMYIRSVYLSRVPRKVRRRLETRLNYLVETGVLYGVLIALLVVLAIDFVRATLIADTPAAKEPAGGVGCDKPKGD